jgi:hypothetical protein
MPACAPVRLTVTSVVQPITINYFLLAEGCQLAGVQSVGGFHTRHAAKRVAAAAGGAAHVPTQLEGRRAKQGCCGCLSGGGHRP